MPILALVWGVFFVWFFFFFFGPCCFSHTGKILLSSTQVPTLPLTEENSTCNLALLEKGWGEATLPQSLKLVLPSRSNWNLHSWGERRESLKMSLTAVVVLGGNGFFLNSGSVQTGVRRQGRPLLSALASPLALGAELLVRWALPRGLVAHRH